MDKSWKRPKMFNLANFRKTEAFGQTVIPNCSILMGQKLVENAKIDNSNETFVAIFQQCANAGNIHWNFFEL